MASAESLTVTSGPRTSPKLSQGVLSSTENLTKRTGSTAIKESPDLHKFAQKLKEYQEKSKSVLERKGWFGWPWGTWLAIGVGLLILLLIIGLVSKKK